MHKIQLFGYSDKTVKKFYDTIYEKEGEKCKLVLSSTPYAGVFNIQAFVTVKEGYNLTEDECKSLIEEAYLQIPDTVRVMMYKCKTIPKQVASVPKNLTSLQYVCCKEKDSIDFVTSLPEHITTLILESQKLDAKAWSNIIKNIPPNITKISLPNLFDFADHELISIFKEFKKPLRQLTLTNFTFEEKDINDARLKKLAVHLPLSVTDLIVPREFNLFTNSNGTRTIKMHDFLFPQSFKSIAEEHNSVFESAISILIDYTKQDSCCPPLTLFFTGNLGRKHIPQVTSIVDRSDNISQLLKFLKAIDLTNSTDSLACRIRFIETLVEADKKNKLSTHPNSSFSLS